MKKTPLVLACFILGAAGVNAADYLGAEAALRKIAAAAPSVPPPAKAEDKDSAEKLQADLEAFQKESPALAPKEAAARWLALVERSGKRLAGRNGSFRRVGFDDLVKVLPGPAAWPALRAQLQSDANPGLQWFVHRLLGDAQAMQTDYEALAQAVSEARPIGYDTRYFMKQIEDATFAISDDGETLLKMLNVRLDAAIKKAESPEPRRQNFGNEERAAFQVPDLLALVGEEKASAFLVRALTSLPGEIAVRGGAETERLAAKLALEHVAQLKAPQWGLAAHIDEGPLYRALIEKFGAPNDKGSKFGEAQTYEFLRLLLGGKTAEAVALSRKMPGFDLAALSQLENYDAVAAFFHKLLAEEPGLPYWDVYVVAAARAGREAEMLKLIRSALQDEALKGAAREQLEKDFVSALLAAGEVEEAVGLLAREAEEDLKKTPAPPNPQGYSGYFPSSSGDTEKSLKITRLGMLMEREEWVKLGLDLASRKWTKLMAKPADFTNEAFATNYAQTLMDLQRGPEAEGILVGALAAREKQVPADENDSFRQLSDTPPSQAILAALAGLYTWAGRPADVLALLDDAPGWGAGDLADNYSLSCYIGDRHSATLGLCAARALAAAGKKDDARRIVNALLEHDAASDRVYELLLALDGQDAMKALDRVFAQDRFEERPLIWKAKLLLDAGKPDEAEKVARQAIKIDPSDGGEGPGDRMRVYDVLADALAAKGDTKDADFFRGVTKSIRLSEKADQFYNAGLLAQAVALYKESLTYFADAYCIQSRLALRLSEMGDWKGAEEHYRKAYELMPDSFGRVESHCFGCERAFAGKRQQAIAEKVFNDMAAAQPDKPQVHYLLGYLRWEDGRYREALPAFQKAVELDPDYLNAWRKLAALSENMHLPAALRNAIFANLLRLDPWQKHGSISLTGTTDLPAAWKALAAFSAKVPPAPTELYPLEASAQATAAQKKALLAAHPEYAPYLEQRQNFNDRRQMRARLEPGANFSYQEFAQAIGNYLQYSAMIER